MAAIVLLPEPDAPITTSTLTSREAVPASISDLRRGGADHKPDKITVRISAVRRQILAGNIFAGKDPLENRALVCAVNQEQHFMGRGERRKSQRHARHIGLHSGLR